MASSAMQPGPEHTGCHSSHAAPQEMPKVCADCASHIFLAPLPLDVVRLAAFGSSLSPLCPRTPLLAFSFTEHSVSVFALAGSVPPPRILTRDVLRL
jgi:hypothetical protein